MSTDILRMAYHPAMKIIKFQRFKADSGQEIPIRRDGRLMPYMNRREGFVLQDQGASFFEDIVRAFNGQSEMEMQVITTKIDYEDFEQMIEYFNKTSECKINATLLAELPSMDVAYSTIKEHGIKSMNILQLHQSIFKDIPQRNDSVKAYVGSFLADVQREIDIIQSKIKSTMENNVNLCFTGVHSTGKSVLINAILGYEIFPVDIKAETAKIFRIQSPQKDQQVRIVFRIHEDEAILEWNQKGVFEFIAGPRENAALEHIQQTIKDNRSKLQHCQMYEILKLLNKDAEVKTDINVYFPIPLDTNQVQFIIYDTPGTDSNVEEHKTVLEDGLAEQTHSILIFVVAPDKIEGEGNSALLNALKMAEQKNSKTCIDRGRSLFVVNKADTVDQEERQELQNAEIKDKSDNSFTMKLSDKKLFFVAARYAYSARAKRNQIATKKEEGFVKKYIRDIQDEDFGEDERYYLQNRCAMSEYATEKQIKLSADAFAQAEAVNNEFDMIHVCSGLFALEHEIKLYGEKFASAVKANAIIKSAEEAFTNMKNTANLLNFNTGQDFEKLDSEIKELRSTIQEGIDAAYNKEFIPKGTRVPIEYIEKLQIHDSVLQEKIMGPAKKFADKILKEGFFFGRVSYEDKDKEAIENHIQSTVDDITRTFRKNRSELLKQVQNRFIASVTSVIENNGNLSAEAKAFLQDIRLKEIPMVTVRERVGSLYDKHKYTAGWIFKSTYINKEKFIADMNESLVNINTDLATGFEEDFRQNLQTILEQVKSEYQGNIGKYSMSITARKTDKEAMGQLREKIVAAAQDLEICQEELNKIIWHMESEDNNE